jgi:hypothetical protein
VAALIKGAIEAASSEVRPLGISKNAFHGIFLHVKAKNAVFALLHFQSLVGIENGGTSLRRADASIISRHPLVEGGACRRSNSARL